jgi:hypothetical protein
MRDEKKERGCHVIEYLGWHLGGRVSQSCKDGTQAAENDPYRTVLRKCENSLEYESVFRPLACFPNPEQGSA